MSKKEPHLVFQGRGQGGLTNARQPKLASATLCPSERDVTNRKNPAIAARLLVMEDFSAMSAAGRKSL